MNFFSRLKIFNIGLISFESLTKDKANQSTPNLIPNFTSFLSFLVIEGISKSTLGKFTPLLDFIIPAVIGRYDIRHY